MDGGTWWATVYGVAKSRTRLSDFAFFHYENKRQTTKWKKIFLICSSDIVFYSEYIKTYHNSIVRQKMWLINEQKIWKYRLEKNMTANKKEKKVNLLSRVWLFVTPWTVAHQIPPSMEFSRQEYWSGLPFPSPGDFSDPGIKHGSPALRIEALPSEPPGNRAKMCSTCCHEAHKN